MSDTSEERQRQAELEYRQKKEKDEEERRKAQLAKEQEYQEKLAAQKMDEEAQEAMDSVSNAQVCSGVGLICSLIGLF